jgi:pyruvate-formate lyase
MNMAKLPEPTAAAYSMSSICHADFNDVGMFDIALPMNDSVTYRQVLTDYIRTCLELKIPVLQPNMVNRAMLLEERQHKGTHPDLVVRICGYSALFGLLSPDMQDEVIARIQA